MVEQAETVTSMNNKFKTHNGAASTSNAGMVSGVYMLCMAVILGREGYNVVCSLRGERGGWYQMPTKCHSTYQNAQNAVHRRNNK